MTKFFNKLKKTLLLAYFWFIFPILGGKFFPGKCHTYGFLAPSQNLEKTKDKIPRKHPDRRKERKTKGRTKGRTDPIL